jgi:hypothetical protein
VEEIPGKVGVVVVLGFAELEGVLPDIGDLEQSDSRENIPFLERSVGDHPFAGILVLFYDGKIFGPGKERITAEFGRVEHGRTPDYGKDWRMFLQAEGQACQGGVKFDYINENFRKTIIIFAAGKVFA